MNLLLLIVIDSRQYRDCIAMKFINDTIWDKRFHFATRRRTLYLDISGMNAPSGFPHASLSASNSLLAMSVIKCDVNAVCVYKLVRTVM